MRREEGALDTRGVLVRVINGEFLASGACPLPGDIGQIVVRRSEGGSAGPGYRTGSSRCEVSRVRALSALIGSPKAKLCAYSQPS